MAEELKPAAGGARYARLGPYRPLLVEDGMLYAARGLELARSTDHGESFTHVAHVPASLPARLFARMRIPARVMRAGLHGLVRHGDGALITVARGAVLRAAPGDPEFSLAHRVTRGSRPLNLAVDRHGVFFGEYFGNPDRSEVHVYGSSDGVAFTPVHTFPAGAVRHVHGVFADPYRNGMWVLTGDDDEESGLWFSDDGFATLERVAGGSQRTRAVCVHVEADGLVVPTDTPRERNRIQWFDPQDGSFRDLFEIDGSVFHAARGRDVRLLSTVVEPSAVNTVQEVTVLGSRDGQRWAEVGRFRRDLPGGRLDRFFRYPQITFAGGSGDGVLYGGGVGLHRLDGALLRWREDELCAFFDEVGV